MTQQSANEIPNGTYARILTATGGEKGHVYVFDSGVEVADFTVPAAYSDDLDEIAIGATMFGWKFDGEPELVGDGQYLARVQRMVQDS